MKRPHRPNRVFIKASFALLALAGAARADETDWPTAGNDPGHSHYAPLSQINPGNVATLAPAWTYNIAGATGRYATIPLVVKGVLYMALPKGAAALDPETGKEIWRFLPDIRPGGRTMRGVSYWKGDAGHAPMILVGAGDRLYGVDAATGLPVEGFGDHGRIELRTGVADKFPDGYYTISNPPAIWRNLLIVGPSIQEFGSHGPGGDPRAFDLRTGKLVWQFHTVPKPGTPGGDTWGPKGGEDRAGPSAWGPITVDEATGTVFVPVGNPADSFNGVDRPGNNLYANSVLALNAATGKLKWFFQTTHHDINDYDLAAPPALIDVVQGGQHIPAIAQATKMGMLFLLDRRTGKPIYGVEERPIPQSNVPGEKSSPTQPFPRKPGLLGRMTMRRADITTITPEANAACTAIWDREQLHPAVPYEPASIYWSNVFIPGVNGGTNWGGVSFHPALGYVFLNITNEPYIMHMAPDGKGGYKLEGAYTRYADPKGWPCVTPPWGELYAVNANTGDVAWHHPFGMAEDYGDKGKDTGTPNNGGSLATASGLLFIGATRDSRFHAYDAATGTELWNTKMPAQAQGTPITYVGKSGRQLVVIQARSWMVAFALPKDGYPTAIMPPPETPAAPTPVP